MTRSIVVGTAGHIDHGKTALVKALTGTDTDRLEEEKRRGITIELGFARWEVGADWQISIVDVPGHERFVRHMIAGAGGIDVVLLVIAADEGVMPQTREHLDICRLLDVRCGVVVLSKVDLVDEEWKALVTEEIGEVLEENLGTRWPVLPFSTHFTPDARADFERRLLSHVVAAPPRRDWTGAPFRLPVDRVFSMRGFGTVVTGTTLGGTAAVGDTVTLLPEEITCKIRGIQCHNQAVERALPRTRTSLNVQGVSASDLRRGSVVCAEGVPLSARVLDVELIVLRSPRQEIRHRARPLVHIGTDYVLATVVMYGVAALEPGACGYARLVLDRPLVALPGDHFVLRGFTPTKNHGYTVAGGRVLATDGVRFPGSEKNIESLARLASVDACARVLECVRRAGPSGRVVGSLGAAVSLGSDEIHQASAQLQRNGAILVVADAAGDVALAREAFEAVGQLLLDMVARFHQENPQREGMAQESVYSSCPEIPRRVIDSALRRLVSDGRLRTMATALIMPDFFERRGRLRGGDVYRAALARYQDSPAAPPRDAELQQELGIAPLDLAALLKLLRDDGQLVRVVDGYHFLADYLGDVERRLVTYLKEHGQITAGEFKTIAGSTRRYTIPLGEYFDRKKLTLRIGDYRKLRGL